jgi:hypothetical protein
MRRRQLIVQLGKMNTPGDEATTSTEEDLGDQLIELLPKILIGAVVAVYGYVLLDTARQVIVAHYN